MSGGGGGSGGEISFVPHVKSVHSWLLTGYDGTENLRLLPFGKAPRTGSMLAALQRAQAGTYDSTGPYWNDSGGAVISAYDSDTPLETVDARISEYKAAIEAIDNTADVDDLVDSFEIATRPQHYRQLAQLAASFSDINAVNSSAFLVAISIAGSEREAQINNYRTQVSLKDRNTKLLHMRHLVDAQFQQTRATIIAGIDKLDQEIEFKRQNLLWDLSLYRYVGNLLGAPTGSVQGRDDVRTGKLQSGLSGAFSGSAIGLEAGGPVGAGVGAVLGGFAGMLGSD